MSPRPGRDPAGAAAATSQHASGQGGDNTAVQVGRGRHPADADDRWSLAHIQYSGTGRAHRRRRGSTSGRAGDISMIGTDQLQPNTTSSANLAETYREPSTPMLMSSLGVSSLLSPSTVLEANKSRFSPALVRDPGTGGLRPSPPPDGARRSPRHRFAGSVAADARSGLPSTLPPGAWPDRACAPLGARDGQRLARDACRSQASPAGPSGDGVGRHARSQAVARGEGTPCAAVRASA